MNGSIWSIGMIVFCHFFCMDRLLAREGINAEQLARDLKSFELKVPLNKLIYTLQSFLH